MAAKMCGDVFSPEDPSVAPSTCVQPHGHLDAHRDVNGAWWANTRSARTGSGDFSIGSDFWPGISKLIEESGEVLQTCGKIIASRGVVEHWDGSNLRACLQDEIADVIAACSFVVDKNGLDGAGVEARVRRKLDRFERWHGLPGGNDPEQQRCPKCGGLVDAHDGCFRCAKEAAQALPTWEQLTERAAADNIVLKHSADHADIQLIPRHSLMGAPFLVFRRVELAEPEADEILRRCVDGALKTMKEME